MAAPSPPPTPDEEDELEDGSLVDITVGIMPSESPLYYWA